MKLQVHIERSLIPGFAFTAVVFLLFLAFFLGEILLLSCLPFSSSVPDDILSIFVCLSSLAFALFLSFLEEKRHGDTQLLQAELHENDLVLSQGKRSWNIPVAEIKEVTKTMQYNRIYDEKGKYKVVIKRKGHRSLTFMTTQKEYLDRCDFEATELSKLYYALRSLGIKCC